MKPSEQILKQGLDEQPTYQNTLKYAMSYAMPVSNPVIDVGKTSLLDDIKKKHIDLMMVKRENIYTQIYRKKGP